MDNNSNEFYISHGKDYVRVSTESLNVPYDNPSHPKLTGDMALIRRIIGLVPAGATGLDAGCGPGARDVYLYWKFGYDITGLDAVSSNIELAQVLHPEISARVSVWDLGEPLPFGQSIFDFVTCNAVIQHISPKLVECVTIPEISRVLKSGGILQLMFKPGEGNTTVYDKSYNVNRSFQLYAPEDIVKQLSENCLDLIEEDNQELSGVMFFTDAKPMTHCVLYARRSNLDR